MRYKISKNKFKTKFFIFFKELNNKEKNKAVKSLIKKKKISF